MYIDKLNGGIAKIIPNNYLDASNAMEFEEQLTLAVKSNPLILVDMKQVEFLDSAALMSIVSAFNLAQSLGRRFILCSLAPSIRIIFELTQLDKKFEIFDSSNSLELA